MIKKTKLTTPERDQIALLFASGSSLRAIARTLSRSVSTISEEIRRNSVDGQYRSIAANYFSRERNLRSRRKNALKDPDIYNYVIGKLRCGWSPEQIAGRLKRQSHGKTILCHETIYRYIYSEDGKKDSLHEYLVRHHYKRQRWHGRYVYRRGIANRVSIHLRPEEANSRREFGHWEGDVVEGKAHCGGIQTLLERKTRLYLARLIPEIDSEYGVKAQSTIFKSVPSLARKSVTFDNGRENCNHQKLRQEFNLDTYFCDPHCAWQRGSNENHNGVLRRYIPKKTDLRPVIQLELDAIIDEINSRPRKCLEYATPKEAFRKELKSLLLSKCSD